MSVQLTRDLIERAFDALGRRAAERGLVVEIAVFGGSCLILASDIRTASGDVDAVIMNEPMAVRQIASLVAAELDLPDDWLNESVKRVAMPPGNPGPNLLPFGEYPRSVSGPIGLRVHLPTPEYMLAMKILANRPATDIDKTQSDLGDAVGLMRITGIETEDGLLAVLKECYPRIPGATEPRVSPRIRARLKALVDDYAGWNRTTEPSWNAGRGPATGDG